MKLKRTLINQLGGQTGAQVRVKGWVHQIRDLGGIRFMVLRDRYRGGI